MQTLKKRLKNRAFILIGTLILIVFILGNFLLGYRIIYKKGERLNSYFSTISIDSKVHNLQTLAYDELKRIDKEISSGNYQSGAEYIGFEENFNRVWLGNSKNSYSFNRYLLYRIRFNGKTCYKYGDGDNKNFKEIILVNLYSYPYTNNIVTIEMKKTLTNPKANNQVSLLAKVDIEYEKGNKNLYVSVQNRIFRVVSPFVFPGDGSCGDSGNRPDDYPGGGNSCVCILCGDKGDGSKWSAVGDLSPQAPVRQDLHDLQKMVDSGLVFICSLSGMVFCLFLAESISHQGAST